MNNKIVSDNKYFARNKELIAMVFHKIRLVTQQTTMSYEYIKTATLNIVQEEIINHPERSKAIVFAAVLAFPSLMTEIVIHATDIGEALRNGKIKLSSILEGATLAYTAYSFDPKNFMKTIKEEFQLQ